MDNLRKTATEAMEWGLSVVAFLTGGFRESVNPDERQRMAHQARSQFKRLWVSQGVASLNLEAYNTIVEWHG